MSNIRLYVGCAPDGLDAESQMVLEYSLRKNTPTPVDITWMKISNDPNSPWHGWDTHMWATPFSGFRWAIPWIEEGEQAIYCDSDFIFLSDLNKLWDQPFLPNKDVMAKGGTEGWRYCLAKWNCANARRHLLTLERLKKLPEAHRRMMSQYASNQEWVQQFAGNWNCIDGEDKGAEEIDALHYSSMQHQPHLKYAIPRLAKVNKAHWFDGKVETHWSQLVKDLFDEYFQAALASGMKVEDYIENDNIEIVKESQKNYHAAHQWVK